MIVMIITHYAFFPEVAPYRYLVYIEATTGICLVVSFLSNFFIKFKVLLKNIITQFIYLVLQIVAIVIFAAFYYDDTFILTSILPCMILYLVFTILGNFIIHTIYRSYNKAKSMSTSARFVDKYYVNSSRYEELLKAYINENNIQYGYVIGFSIKTKTHCTEEQINSIYKTYASVIHDFFYKYNSFFFKTRAGNFFCFIKSNINEMRNLQIAYKNANQSNREVNDPFIKFRDFKNSITDSNIDIKGMTTIYGVHDSDINRLIKIDEDMIGSLDLEPNTSVIYLYDPNLTQLQTDNLYQYNVLKHIIDDSKIYVDFLSFEIDGHKIYAPTYGYFSHLIYNYDNLINIVPTHLRQIAMRHFSAVAIQHFSQNQNINKHLLIIKYPIEKLEYAKFSVQEITNKIYTFYLKPNQIIFNINLKFMNLDATKYLFNNIERLKKYGYKISVSNVTVDNIEIVKTIKPFMCFYKHMDFVSKTKNNQYDNLMQQLLNKYNLKFLI
jgi:hypothetical protein